MLYRIGKKRIACPNPRGEKAHDNARPCNQKSTKYPLRSEPAFDRIELILRGKYGEKRDQSQGMSRSNG